MAVNNLHIPPFPKFYLDDQNTISIRWEKYKKRFDNLSVALNIKDDKQKLALFLNYAGEELYDIYDNLLVPGAVVPENSTEFAEAIKLLDSHLNPKCNITYEIYLFRQLKQQIDEAIQTFYIRVKQQALKCNFKDTEDEIKQQLILATNINKLRRHAFANPEMSLQQLLTYGKNLEDISKK